MKTLRIIIALVFSTILISSCSPPGEKIEVIEQRPMRSTVKVAVSDECSMVAKELLNDFAAGKSMAFEIAETHSPHAKNVVAQGSADLAIVTVRMTPSGEEDFTYIPFAYNGIIFIADSAAGLMELSKKQVRDIFFGSVKNWKELGGNDLSITVIIRPPNSSALRAAGRFLGVESLSFGPDVKTFFAETNLAAQAATMRLSGFFGFVLMSGTRSTPYNGIPLKIEGMEAVAANVPQNGYPIPQEIAFVTRPEYRGEVKDLIDFVFSTRGMHKLAAFGLAPVSGNMKIVDCHCRSRDGTVFPSNMRNMGTLTLGIVPELDVTIQDKRYREMAQILAEELSLVIRLKHFESYERVVDEFRKGVVEAAFVGSYTYGLLRESPRVVPVARPEVKGKSEYRGLLIVLKESGLQRFEDLRGKRVSYVPFTTAGELFMKGLVASKGASEDTYFSETYPVLSHEDSLNVLFDGKVDGAFIKDLVLERIFNNHRDLGEKIVILETSGMVPENALVVTPGIYRMMGEEFRSVLMNLQKNGRGRKALREMGADRFVPTVHEDYKNLYMMAKKAGEKI